MLSLSWGESFKRGRAIFFLKVKIRKKRCETVGEAFNCKIMEREAKDR